MHCQVLFLERVPVSHDANYPQWKEQRDGDVRTESTRGAQMRRLQCETASPSEMHSSFTGGTYKR